MLKVRAVRARASKQQVKGKNKKESERAILRGTQSKINQYRARVA